MRRGAPRESKEHAMAQRPNILFIHADQLHWQALSAYGNTHGKTPNLDRMAADGRSFRASYATMPQCCPARASRYTGRMSGETGVPVNECRVLPGLPDLGQWPNGEAEPCIEESSLKRRASPRPWPPPARSRSEPGPRPGRVELRNVRVTSPDETEMMRYLFYGTEAPAGSRMTQMENRKWAAVSMLRASG